MVRVRTLAAERAANPPLPNPFSDRHVLRGILYELGLQVHCCFDQVPWGPPHLITTRTATNNVPRISLKCVINANFR